jgi:hypothetical protein
MTVKIVTIKFAVENAAVNVVIVAKPAEKPKDTGNLE